MNRRRGQAREAKPFVLPWERDNSCNGVVGVVTVVRILLRVPSSFFPL